MQTVSNYLQKFAVVMLCSLSHSYTYDLTHTLQYNQIEIEKIADPAQFPSEPGYSEGIIFHVVVLSFTPFIII